MNPAPITAPPSSSHTPQAARRSNPVRSEPDVPARQTFEQMLSDRETRTSGASEEEAPEKDERDAAAWGLLPPPVRLQRDEQSSGDDTQPEPDGTALQGGVPAARLAEPAVVVTATPPAPAPVTQSDLYAHLALPQVTAAERGRFEVLDGSLLSSVAVDAHGHGGMTVTVAAPSQHAALLERHLPQLQRRLSEKVSTHMRVEERTRHDR